jgi:hypothetical protein
MWVNVGVKDCVFCPHMAGGPLGRGDGRAGHRQSVGPDSLWLRRVSAEGNKPVGERNATTGWNTIRRYRFVTHFRALLA